MSSKWVSSPEHPRGYWEGTIRTIVPGSEFNKYLPARAVGLLSQVEITKISQLKSLSAVDLLRIPGFGRKYLRYTNEMLDEIGWPRLEWGWDNDDSERQSRKLVSKPARANRCEG